MRGRPIFAVILSLASLSLPAVAATPQALFSDPPPDKVYPAGMEPFALPTGGTRINAMLLTAAGAGRHPTVLLFHGIAGNEQNLDLARAIQRAGWNVLTLHYRGSWGSPGRYSLEHCLEDGSAALAWLRDPSTALAGRIDRRNIVLIGHSLGGFVAAFTAGHDDGVAATALISAGRVAGTAPGSFSQAELARIFELSIRNDAGMHALGDATAAGLARESIGHASRWDLTQFAPMLARHPLLVVNSDDGTLPSSNRLADAVTAQAGARVARVHLATDHNYDDQRIALTTTILSWLESLPLR